MNFCFDTDTLFIHFYFPTFNRIFFPCITDPLWLFLKIHFKEYVHFSILFQIGFAWQDMEACFEDNHEINSTEKNLREWLHIFFCFYNKNCHFNVSLLDTVYDHLIEQMFKWAFMIHVSIFALFHVKTSCKIFLWSFLMCLCIF